MRESRPYGSERGAFSNGRPYRDRTSDSLVPSGARLTSSSLPFVGDVGAQLEPSLGQRRLQRTVPASRLSCLAGLDENRLVARRSLKAPGDHSDVERIELDAAADPAKNNYANRLRSRSAFRPGPINGDCCHFATLPAKAPSLPLVSRESPCCSAQRKVPHFTNRQPEWTRSWRFMLERSACCFRR